jgi:hypothetical protein
LAALVTLLGAWTSLGQGTLRLVLGATGLAPLVALIGGLGRMPPGALPGIGLWLIGAGSLAILLGLALDWRFARAESALRSPRGAL